MDKTEQAAQEFESFLLIQSEIKSHNIHYQSLPPFLRSHVTSLRDNSNKRSYKSNYMRRCEHDRKSHTILTREKNSNQTKNEGTIIKPLSNKVVINNEPLVSSKNT
ncbi:hypothetical protein AKO1_002575 [Acrasis kona]|uniref:Uncharacterized protein n=1 Tax=Acrasis kona TaxID=1008807 RepID=A0AAW2ZGL7_9EUKA